MYLLFTTSQTLCNLLGIGYQLIIVLYIRRKDLEAPLGQTGSTPSPAPPQHPQSSSRRWAPLTPVQKHQANDLQDLQEKFHISCRNWNFKISSLSAGRSLSDHLFPNSPEENVEWRQARYYLQPTETHGFKCITIMHSVTMLTIAQT